MMTAAEIRERFNSGVPMEFLLFWGHQPTNDGSITKSCLSQWYEAAFELGGFATPPPSIS